jgi:hypothetical protein
MNLVSTIVLGLALLSGSTAAHAQVYESRDAAGNPVFSDTPSPGAEVVDLPESNVADPVDVPSAPPAADPETEAGAESQSGPVPATQGTASGPGDKVIVIGDERLEAASESGRKIGQAQPREQVLDAEPREEVLDAEPREQVLDAEPRDEVLDAEPRRQVD